MALQVWPLAGGINSHIDRRLLPDGALADATNVELDREGRLIGRAKYTAQATTCFGTGSLVAYDLFTLNDRLFALGSAASRGFADDIFEFVGSGLAAQWKPSTLSSATTARLPRATQVRDLGRPPDMAGGVTNMGCSATSGFVCLVWNNDESTKRGFVHIFRASINQTVAIEAYEDVSFANDVQLKLRTVALSDRFIILGISTLGSELGCAGFTLASSESSALLNASLFTGGAISVYACCKVAGTDQFVVVANVAGTVITRRFDSAGTLQVPSGSAYSNVVAAATNLAVEASSTANQINIAMVVGGEARIFTYNLSTGAQIGAGPHVPFSTSVITDISLARLAADNVTIVGSCTNDTPVSIRQRNYTPSTNTFVGPAGGSRTIRDAQLAASAFYSVDELVMGIRIGADGIGGSPNTLATTSDATSPASSDTTIQVAKDLETAISASALLPDLTQDASTGLLYWANASANPDSDAQPCVTELSMTSTKRRQYAQLGNLVYFAGGCPLVFDGVNAVEMGFTQRPRIVSLTGSNGSGTPLLPGATYDYRYHQEWVDSDKNLHLSAASTISSITLTSSQDTVTAVVSGPHSQRRNRGANNGAVRGVLSRTLATSTSTAATLTGRATATPPASSLTGLTLFILISDTTGYQMFTVTFDAGSVDADAIVVDINAVTTGRVTASNADGHIRLTANEIGEGAYLEVSGGTASGILGFITYEFDVGTTAFTKGENFQRAATGSSGAPGNVADTISIVDTRKDQSDPIVDSDLIRQQVLYSQGVASGSHHSPPPSEYIWAGRERLWFTGQPNRSKATASKLVVPGEPAECAFEGFLGFTRQVTGDIEAHAVIGDALVVWTRHQIWVVTGAGPGRNGVGEFFAPDCISRAVGIIADGWRSLVQDDFGIWFQGSDHELYRISRAGQLDFMGAEVQDKLDTYPVVTAALYVKSKQEVAFAVQNSAGNAGGILRYQASAKAWFFDDVGAISSMADYQGRIAYVQSGIVYIQDAAPGSGTFVAYNVTSGMFQGFGALGYGNVHEIGFLGTFRGPCNVELFLSRDGDDFSQSLGEWDLTDAEYDVGDRVRLLLQPPEMAMDSFALKCAVTYAGTDSEGVWLHALGADTEQSPNFVRVGPTHKL